MTEASSKRFTARWQSIRTFVATSLSDNQSDVATGPIGRALGLLAIPMMLEMSMEAVFAVVDIAFVSLLGTAAIAAVGLTEALITILYALAIGLGMGVTALVARCIGAKKPSKAARVIGQAIWIGAVLALLIGAAGIVFAENLLSMMGASDDVIATGKGFIAVMLGGNASILFLFILTAGFRGAGDAPVALRALTLANGLNIVLDPCFIFGVGPFPEMGVTGAAVATTIGRSAGVTYLFWYLLAGRGRLQFARRDLRLQPRLLLRLLRISAGGIAQFLIATASWIVIMRIVALFGSAAIAAYTIALRMMEFVFLPAWGLGNAAATLVGQNLGAGKPERAEKSVWTASRYNALFMSVLAIVFILQAPAIVAAFSTDPEIVAYGVSCLRIMALGYPMYAVGMIVIQALNGAGNTRTPALLNFIAFWVLQIPLAYWLATAAGLGPNGVFAAIVVSESVLTIMSVLVLRSGSWRTQQV